MTICYFGDYDPSYNRTKILLAGLRDSGIEVLECNARGRGLALYRELGRKHRALAGRYDALIVGYGNARLLPVFARSLTRAPIAWDALYSLYDNWVFDRKLAPPKSAKAAWYRLVDKLGCGASDLVVLDTDANADYFHAELKVPRRKLVRALVGADTDTFRPAPKEGNGPFTIEFHGKYIPVQGADVIVRAAALLAGEDIRFVLIGGGQEHAATKKLAEELGTKNVEFLPFLPLTEVARRVRDADACIGLLGDVPRVVRAIPNKLYEAAASARVSINADTPALREVFAPGTDVVGVKAGDPEDLARAIRELKGSGRAEAMGKAAYETFRNACEPRAIVAPLLARLAALKGGADAGTIGA